MSWQLPESEPSTLVPEDIAFDVVHEDSALIVINKPAGLVVHPGAGHRQGTLVNGLLSRVKDLGGIGGELRPGIVHRLDKDTSGLMVVAKTESALASLQKAFAARDVAKSYLALVHGAPPREGTFDTWHARHPTQRLRFSSKVNKGKRAVTHYKVRTQWAQAAEVEVALETGRTHQIRVHFADAGFPLLADALYGGRRVRGDDAFIARQALHAWKLSFIHPRSNKAVNFTAPVPADFQEARARLKS